MKSVFALFFCVSLGYTSTLTLEKLDLALETTHPLFLAIEDKEAMHKARIDAENASSAFVLSAGVAQAHPDNSDEEMEYSAGVSKNFLLGNQREKNREIARYKNKVRSLAFQNELLAFSNTMKAEYHQACLNQEQRALFQESFAAFNKLYIKKRKAYQYKEISYKELLQLESEKIALEVKLARLKSEERISKEVVLDVLNTQEQYQELSCEDLYPLVYKADEEKLFSLSKEQYNQQLLAAKKSEALYDREFESIDLSIGYDKEIDMQRYGVGFELPLLFTAKKDEYKKIHAVRQQRVLKLEKQNFLQQKQRKYKQLKANLENNQNLIMMTEKNIHTFKKRLLPLIEKSYTLGESSVLEYLLSKQKLLQLQETLSSHKKDFYNTLFTLYTVAEMKETK